MRFIGLDSRSRRGFLGDLACGLGLTLLGSSLTGCGGGDDSGGDDKFSQKFEKPAGAPEGGATPDAYSERKAEKEKAQSAPTAKSKK